MNKLIITLLLCCMHCAACAGDADSCLMSLSRDSRVQKDGYVILFLKGGDCINCYRSGQMAIDRGLFKPDIIMIGDIPKKFVPDFLQEELHISNDSWIIYDQECWDSMNVCGSSAVAWVDDGKIVNIIALQHVMSNICVDYHWTLKSK